MGDARVPWLCAGRQASSQKTTEELQVKRMSVLFSFKLDAALFVSCRDIT